MPLRAHVRARRSPRASGAPVTRRCNLLPPLARPGENDARVISVLSDSCSLISGIIWRAVWRGRTASVENPFRVGLAPDNSRQPPPRKYTTPITAPRSPYSWKTRRYRTCSRNAATAPCRADAECSGSRALPSDQPSVTTCPGSKRPFAADPPDSVYFAPFSAKLAKFRAQVTRVTDRPLRRIGAEPDNLLYVVSEPPTIGSRAIKFGLERYDTLLMLRRRRITGQSDENWPLK